jgi:hypothetical protein
MSYPTSAVVDKNCLLTVLVLKVAEVPIGSESSIAGGPPHASVWWLVTRKIGCSLIP